ncbi:hypothetical protein ACFVGY_18750 [Streptomyces sp. NPDC127106]|uniref:hypothetical protein n=1 Tax=Streptomyces sp. NPDC127106 TaxID=3345360 RepID=UPI0036315930
MFRAQFPENADELDRTRTDVEAALACFRQVDDCWGQSEALPLRARLRRYDGDLDGALADLREARSLADEFGSLSPPTRSSATCAGSTCTCGAGKPTW